MGRRPSDNILDDTPHDDILDIDKDANHDDNGNDKDKDDNYDNDNKNDILIVKMITRQWLQWREWRWENDDIPDYAF